MPASPSPIPFERLPGYEIESKLGSGGMGVVYKALDLKLHRTVALKFLNEHQAGADHHRLLREARAASALDHPNIAAIHTIEELPEGRAFIVMGYYKGETLADKLRHGPLQPARAINFALQIARGLQHAHERGVIHRDIKPSNVLITDEGVAKILDFGLASSYGAAASTDTAALRGTLPYMSPEQLQNREPDARTDIWSLGAVLHQTLTGSLPFFADSPGGTLMAILTSPPPAMTGVSDELQLIVFRMLAKDPAARYQSCTEIMRDLEVLAVDDSHPTATVAPSDLQRQLRSAVQSASGVVAARSRHAVWLALALCLAVGLGLALLVSSFRARVFGPEQKHIVVLPFETTSSDAATQSVADGLMETISEKLSNLDAGQQSLWIVPSSEVRRRKIDDARTAARELGATIAVTGRIVRSGNGLRLTMDVIDAKSIRLLGSASVQESLLSEASVDDEAVQRIASILRLGVRPGAPPNTAVGSAYDAYLQGRGYLQRFDKPGNLDQAIQLFQQATAADPQFALGFASLGEAYWDKYRLDQNPEWLKQASDYCDHAITLNPGVPAIYAIAARIHEDAGHHDVALQEFEQALKLDPRNADAHLGRATVYEHLGRIKDAEDEYKTAIAMRPDYWLGISELGSFYVRQNRPDDALREFRREVDVIPDSANAHSNYGAMLSRVGRSAEAIVELQKSLSISESYAAYANLGILYYRQKDWANSARMTEKALSLNPNDYRVWANLGIAYEEMGDASKAAEAYRQEFVYLSQQAKVKGDDPTIQCELALLYSKNKDRGNALLHLNAALARSPNDARLLADSAEIYQNLGDHDRAVAQVQKSLAKGWTWDRLSENPGLRPVLSDPRLKH